MIELLAEGGLDACTFQNVAERAGVERSTLYRRNPDKWPTIVQALLEYASKELPANNEGSFRRNLSALLHNVRRLLAGPVGGPLLAVAAALQGGTAPGLVQEAWGRRLVQLSPIFDLAIERGELRPDVDRDQLLARAAGPLFFYALMIGRPADDDVIDAIVNGVCDSFGVPE
ncbi:MAG TPA: TetR/AcrR family transcriptional regulator [Sphingomicrobium sp.]|nr:TetR/AcrR family transcriptional regulator [Sphingomicrobium sp.]